MVTLNYTLSLESTARLHDVLSCLGKFGDTVSIEARKDILTLSTLNSSKSGYASATLDQSFFSRYQFKASTNAGGGRFTCSISNRALLSVFKSRLLDSRGRDTAIDRCEVSVQDGPEEAECRFIIRMVCTHGVTKTYRLTFESVEVMHALFDRNSALNRWTIRSQYLREFVDFFAPKAEQLDIYCEENKVTFLSFTEKVANAKNEILKHPLRTSVAVDRSDFELFEAQEKVHTIISAKDFKAIVTHAATFDTAISAYYSIPGRPFQFSYSHNAVQCQFTLMTAGDYQSAQTSREPSAQIQSGRSTRAQSTTTTRTEEARSFSTDMPPPAAPKSRRTAGKLGQNESRSTSSAKQAASQESDSLFVRNDDDDRRWDPPNYEDDEEIVGWNASVDNDAVPHPTFTDSGTSKSRSFEAAEEGLPPTQRVSQIKGLW